MLSDAKVASGKILSSSKYGPHLPLEKVLSSDCSTPATLFEHRGGEAGQVGLPSGSES